MVREELAQDGQEHVSNEDAPISGNEDDFFDAEEDCVNMFRQDSNSSFDIISDDEVNAT